MNVFLDGKRLSPDGWIRVFSLEDTIAMLETGKMTGISHNHVFRNIEEDYHRLVPFIYRF